MSRPKPSRSKTNSPRSSPWSQSVFEKAMHDLKHQPAGAYPDVPARWLLKAVVVTLGAIVLLAWACLCLLYWQGSWQLLYHPSAAVTRTPASVGLAYEPIRLATAETGTTQLTGWWLPNDNARYTVLYLHGATGNLGDTVDALAALHSAGLAVFAIDYRGYGQSQPVRPSEAHWLEDANHALDYLNNIRHIPSNTIVLFGDGLGANLAAKLATSHSSLAGIILDQPQQNATAHIFNDPRSRLVPAHWLVKDRYDLNAAAGALQVPSLWLLTDPEDDPTAYTAVPIRKTKLWLKPSTSADPNFVPALRRWIDDL